MKLKNILKTALSFCVVAVTVISCTKKETPAPLPVNPTLSKTSVAMEINSVDTIVISGGKAPYTITVSDNSKLAATLSDNKIILTTNSKTASSTAPITVTVTGADKGVSTASITIGDPYADAKASSKFRFEQSGASALVAWVANDSSIAGIGYFNVYRDNGKMFGSTKQKYGWSTGDGKNFLFFEVNGDAKSVGKKTDCRIYVKKNGATPAWINCSKAEVIQSASGITWITFQLEDGTKGLVVQPWIQ